MYLVFKTIHITCAVISVLGFTIRGYMVIRGKTPITGFVLKVLPHIIDTVLLVSAMVLVVMSRQYPFTADWVTVKVFALLAYIVLGICFMRISATKIPQVSFFILALTTAGYIFLVAISKNPLPFVT